ncbi:MAG: hypothetical protein Q9M26_09185 [Mariprofundales bacterium]|nr:hypothetical protein [Mariprofundales bacterium]
MCATHVPTLTRAPKQRQNPVNYIATARPKNQRPFSYFLALR